MADAPRTTTEMDTLRRILVLLTIFWGFGLAFEIVVLPILGSAAIEAYALLKPEAFKAYTLLKSSLLSLGTPLVIYSPIYCKAATSYFYTTVSPLIKWVWIEAIQRSLVALMTAAGHLRDHFPIDQATINSVALVTLTAVVIYLFRNVPALVTAHQKVQSMDLVKADERFFQDLRAITRKQRQPLKTLDWLMW